MNIRQALKMAVKSISSNKARSFLTMLGVIIGLAAVIILVSYAQGNNLALKAYYDSMGTNVLQVYAYSWNKDVGQELYDYCLGLDNVEGITPMGNVYTDLNISYGAKTLSRNRGGGSMISIGGGVWVEEAGGGGQQQEDHYPTVQLANDQFGMCNDYKLAKGREFSHLEVQNMSQVCILGSDTAEYLFSFANPIGKTVTINGLPFQVIGVYQSKSTGVKLGKTSEEDQWVVEDLKRKDKLLVLPHTMTRYFNRNEPIEQYMVKVSSADDLADVVTTLKSFLTNLIGSSESGFSSGWFDVTNPGQWQKNMDEQDAVQQRFLAGIAAISLLVGGIGIMNIMLVTVTERTREIGIRKAIGAERRSIIAQFLIEAAMICGIGGILGIAVGFIGTMLITKLSFGLVIIPGTGIAAAAFGISVVLGIIFGLYPAIKASGLQPVDALRAE